jgi:hypothetical protein
MPAPKIIDLTTEQAYEMANALSGATRHDKDSMTIFHGKDVEHGLVWIVIPPLGDATLLPVAFQDFAS